MKNIFILSILYVLMYGAELTEHMSAITANPCSATPYEPVIVWLVGRHDLSLSAMCFVTYLCGGLWAAPSHLCIVSCALSKHEILTHLCFTAGQH